VTGFSSFSWYLLQKINFVSFDSLWKTVESLVVIEFKNHNLKALKRLADYTGSLKS